MYPTNSGTLSFEGSTGQLFSISNTMSGTIYSVNDVSGMPSIEVLDSGNIKLAQYSGNVGIGLSTPTKKLQVYTTTNTDGITITGGPGATNTSLIINNTGSSGNSWDISSTAGGHGYGDGKLLFGIGFSAKAAIDSAGNVGINSTSPNAKLHVNQGSGSEAQRWGYSADQANYHLSLIPTDTGAGQVYWTFQNYNTSNQASLTFRGNNIGIGSTAPLTFLNINGTQPTGVRGYAGNGVADQRWGGIHIEANDAYTSQYGGRISFGGNSGGSWTRTIYGTIEAYKTNSTSAHTGGGLDFWTTRNDDGMMYKRMRIEGDGVTNAGTVDIYGGLVVSGTTIATQYNIGNYDVSSTAAMKVYFGTNNDNNYGMGKRTGAWTQPMDIAFYTGIKYHAHNAYNGHRFFVAGYDSTEAFSIGNGDANVRVLTTTASSSSTTGALLVAGGLGVAGRISAGTGSGSANGFGFDSDTGMVSSGDGNLKFYTNNVYAGGPVTGTQNWDINITGNADTVDSVHAANIVYGTGTAAWGKHCYGISGDSKQGLNAGFYDGNGLTNMPTSDWYHLIVNTHNNSYSGNQYELHIASAFWDSNLWWRKIHSSGQVGWYNIIHSGNISTQAVSTANYLLSPNGSTVMASDSAMPAVANTMVYTLGNGPLSNDGHILGMTWNSASSYGAQLWFDTDPTGTGAFRQRSNAGVWTSWNTFLHSNNYNSYSPTLGGVGATGNWNISIQGNAATASSATYATSAGYAGYLVNSYAYTNGSDGWWRTAGAAGWYNASYTSGIYSQSSQLVETYNSSSFKVNGHMYATGNVYSSYSDSRLKENIKPIENALDKLKAIRGITFTPNDLAISMGQERTEQVGVIAQEVQAVLPQVVGPAPFDQIYEEDGTPKSKSGENYTTVQYDRIVPLLIEAVKDLSKQVEEQRILINSLLSKEVSNDQL